jgi:hypothetical protein
VPNCHGTVRRDTYCLVAQVDVGATLNEKVEYAHGVDSWRPTDGFVQGTTACLAAAHVRLAAVVEQQLDEVRIARAHGQDEEVVPVHVHPVQFPLRVLLAPALQERGRLPQPAGRHNIPQARHHLVLGGLVCALFEFACSRANLEGGGGRRSPPVPPGIPLVLW